MSDTPMRDLPAVHVVLGTKTGKDLLAAFRREFVVRAVREVLEASRSGLRKGHRVSTDPEDIAQRALAKLSRLAHPGPHRAINATGVVLHTGLGRAPLPAEWLQTGYCDLEIRRDTGERGSRQDHLRDTLAWLTGAEDALVVNNNAAATLLAVQALAAGREVLVARGQLVEIGGSFRLPEVIATSGARLVEVGATNRVRLDDYLRAWTPDTAMILKVHPSNFRMQGFTEDVPAAALAEVAQERGVPLVYDLGSGCLFDTTAVPGLQEEPPEPQVQQAVADGCDLVCFSGDKLLGGPQAGIILGRAERIATLRKHPLARAVRVDKLALSALAGCLGAHMRADLERVPTRELLTRPVDELRGQAEALCAMVREALPGAGIFAEPGEGAPGSGSLPATTLPSWRVRLRTDDPQGLARSLRYATPPVFGLVRDGAVMLDMRCVLPVELEDLARILLKVLGEES